MNQDYKNLIKYVSELLLDRNYHKDVLVQHLSEEEQAKFAGLLIEYYERDTIECFYEPSQDIRNDDITCSLLMLLKDINNDKKEDLANLIIKRSIERFKGEMQDILDQERANILADEMHSHGYYNRPEYTTNENVWSNI